MKALNTIVWMIVCGVIAGIIGYALSLAIISSYESTGNLVTAKDTIEAKAMPYLFAIIGLYAGYKFTTED